MSPTPLIRNATADAYAAATTANVWREVQADCRDLSGPGTRLDNVPLWRAENPLIETWTTVRQELPKGWEFWRDWYQNALDGVPPNWDMLTEIALVEPEDWDKGAEHVNGLIAGIVGEIYAPDDAPSDVDGLLAQSILSSAIGDYKFDDVGRVMRLVPFQGELDRLDDAKALAQFLKDASDMRTSAQKLCNALGAESGIQGAGAVRTYLGSVLDELGKSEDVGNLNVGMLVEDGKILENYVLDEPTKAEFGALHGALETVVARLLELTRNHFSATLLRLAPLHEATLPDDMSAWDAIDQVRKYLKSTQNTETDAFVPMDAEDMAGLERLLETVDRLARAQDGATTEQAKSSFQKEINYHLALVSVSTSLFFARSREQAGSLGNLVDVVLKQAKRGKGLWWLWDIFNGR